MNEISANLATVSSSELDFKVRARLDALEHGECTEDDFLRDILMLRESAPNSVWIILALIDERDRSGRLPADLFRSIKARITRHAIEDRDYGATVELHPTSGSSGATAQRTAQFDSARPKYISRAEDADKKGRKQSDLLPINGPPVAQSAPPADRTELRPWPHALQVGCVLRDRYVLESLLGRGGMGTVFKALDRRRIDLSEGDRYVALKVLDENISQRPEILADLRREFYCAQALSHPNIVKVYEMHDDDDVAFYTMELLEGELLSSVLLRTHPVPLARSHAWAIIQAVGVGLAHAHSRNVVHGDLKPQNLMITESGEVRVLDFGASSAATRRLEISDPLQRNHFPKVTPAYTCCELLDGQQTDPRDDLYALACLSYELLAGKHPFQRLRSTEARDLGMAPFRPRGLKHRQWRSLQLGLSWYRESRSLSVGEWLAKMGLNPVPERLPPPRALDAMHPRRLNPGAAPRVALLAVLISGLGLWIAFRHESADINVGGKPSAPIPTFSASTDAQTFTGLQMPLSDAKRDSKPGATGFLIPPLLPELLSGLVAGESELPHESMPPEPAVSASRTIAANKIAISAADYSVHSGEHFAEIDVRRSDESRGNGSFVWWTEASSANPGNDFVSQDRTMQFFPKGKRTTKLFVRIVPNPSRTQAETFFVVIGQPSRGYSMGPITRAAILIPPVG
jgi:serine/threonine protein kinase